MSFDTTRMAVHRWTVSWRAILRAPAAPGVRRRDHRARSNAESESQACSLFGRTSVGVSASSCHQPSRLIADCEGLRGLPSLLAITPMRPQSQTSIERHDYCYCIHIHRLLPHPITCRASIGIARASADRHLRRFTDSNALSRSLDLGPVSKSSDVDVDEQVLLRRWPLFVTMRRSLVWIGSLFANEKIARII